MMGLQNSLAAIRCCHQQSQSISQRTKFRVDSNPWVSDGQSSVRTYRRTLSQLVRSHHLHVQVFGLRLAAGLNEPLQHLEAKKGRMHKFKGSNSAEDVEALAFVIMRFNILLCTLIQV